MLSGTPPLSRQNCPFLSAALYRCVYDCDNDVCDNQAVNMQFANGAIATLSMVATTASIGDRSTRIFGSLGQVCNGCVQGGSGG